MGGLALGTVQLGMDYGVCNRTGKPAFAEALAIVRGAFKGGVREFDTAQGYGDSEAVLGRAFAELGIADRVAVTSKCHAEPGEASPEEVADLVGGSLERLGVPRLSCLLWHREAVLEQGDLAAAIVDSLRGQGLSDRFGVSVYSPELALRALETGWVDLVQLPGNILDRRFERAGVFALAAELGKAICLRSVFLQGLLLAAPDEAARRLAPMGPILGRMHALAGRLGTTPLSLCLGFVRRAYPDATVLFGAETRGQVDEALEGWAARLPEDVVESVRTEFGDIDERILNPVRWKELAS
ncbi:MAG: aldo/keto reductase [Pseudodesulfovibrio sp.]